MEKYVVDGQGFSVAPEDLEIFLQKYNYHIYIEKQIIIQFFLFEFIFGTWPKLREIKFKTLSNLIRYLISLSMEDFYFYCYCFYY